MLEDPVEIDRDMGKHISRPALHALRLEAARAVIEIAAGGAEAADGAGGAGGALAAAAGGGGDVPPFGGFAFLAAGGDWRLQEHGELLGTARVAALLPVPRAEEMDVRLVSDRSGCAQMMAALDGKAVIAIDCEGEALSRSGRLCLVQIAAEGTRDWQSASEPSRPHPRDQLPRRRCHWRIPQRWLRPSGSIGGGGGAPPHP